MNTKARPLISPVKTTLVLFVSGLVLHMVLLSIFSKIYMEALRHNFWFGITIVRGLLSSCKEVYDWCFRYTGWFLFPLFGCLMTVAWRFVQYVAADLRKNPLPSAQYRIHCFHASYIGNVATLLGTLGTLVYIIAGLGMMALAIVELGKGISDTASANKVLELLPTCFRSMSKAILMLVPALGTTVVGLIVEGLVNHILFIVQKWERHKQSVLLPALEGREKGK